MRKINSREDQSTTFDASVGNIIKNMEDALFPRLAPDKNLAFALAIDATHVAGFLQVNTKCEVMCDRTHQNHWISTQNLSKEEALNICRQDTAAKIAPEIAAEAKVCLLVAQNTPK